MSIVPPQTPRDFLTDQEILTIAEEVQYSDMYKDIYGVRPADMWNVTGPCSSREEAISMYYAVAGKMGILVEEIVMADSATKGVNAAKLELFMNSTDNCLMSFRDYVISMCGESCVVEGTQLTGHNMDLHSVCWHLDLPWSFYRNLERRLQHHS